MLFANILQRSPPAGRANVATNSTDIAKVAGEGKYFFCSHEKCHPYHKRSQREVSSFFTKGSYACKLFPCFTHPSISSREETTVF